MADKKCPNCGLWNASSAIRCDCGYDFTINSVRASPAARPVPLADAVRQAGQRDMLYGALWFVGGVIVTVATYAWASGGGTYIVAWGAIIFGAYRFLRGVIRSRR